MIHVDGRSASRTIFKRNSTNRTSISLGLKYLFNCFVSQTVAGPESLILTSLCVMPDLLRARSRAEPLVWVLLCEGFIAVFTRHLTYCKCGAFTDTLPSRYPAADFRAVHGGGSVCSENFFADLAILYFLVQPRL